MIGPATLIGQRYELGPLIGAGGMAEVRSGWDRRLERAVAIKLLRPEMAAQEGARQRFESEARLAARLIHPNVVSVYDSGEDGGVPFIVMERLPGTTLADVLRSGPLDEARGRSLAVDLLSALEAAHAASVLHRDIKPANILVSAGSGPPERWKLGDFGIAKAVEAAPSEQTVAGLLLGTPAYIAPERLRGEPVTPASDIFSVGAVLYEALSGHKPTDGPGADVWAAAAAGPRHPPLLARRPDIDPGLAAAVERALAPDPADRFPSAAEMRTAVLSDRSSRPATQVVPFAMAEPTALLPPRPLPPAPKRPRPLAWAAAVAALAVVIGLATGLATGRSPAPRPAGATVPGPPAPTSTSTPASPGAPVTAPAPPAPGPGPQPDRQDGAREKSPPAGAHSPPGKPDGGPHGG